MNRDYDDFSYDDEDEEEDLEEIKETRKKRIQNKKRDKQRREFDEIRLKPDRQRKPRAKFHYDPDYDEDDYEDYYYG